MIVIRARFRAFAESMKTGVVTFANTLQASQKTISILAKFAFAPHASQIKTVHNGDKGKTFKMKRNVILCLILAMATCALAYLTRGLQL